MTVPTYIIGSAFKFLAKFVITNCYKAIQCNSWVHIKCNDLNYNDYKFLQNSNDPWFCISCCSENFPFNTVKITNSVSTFYDSNSKSKTN